jgi:2-oxo-4-hydroxy-4-carboxy-5-ureidoimidazoline decarboxylase
MTLTDFNSLSASAASAHLASCCAAERWQQLLVQQRPFADLSALLSAADHAWAAMAEADFLQAFSAHPQIGNVDTLRAKYANTKALAAGEQSAVQQASEATLQALAQGNSDYLARFGFIFIVCATGKSAEQMQALLTARLPNSRAQELLNGAAEQHKITRLRLQKLFLNDVQAIAKESHTPRTTL